MNPARPAKQKPTNTGTRAVTLLLFLLCGTVTFIAGRLTAAKQSILSAPAGDTASISAHRARARGSQLAVTDTFGAIGRPPSLAAAHPSDAGCQGLDRQTGHDQAVHFFDDLLA